MSMVTNCPGCGTTFRVTPQQLQAYEGQVRCGRCARVFNAFDSLATYQEPAAPETRTSDISALRAESQPAGEKRSQASLSGLDFTLPRKTSRAPGPEAQPLQGIQTLYAEQLEFVKPPGARAGWPWHLGSFALLILLAGQAAYFFRTELTFLAPATKPYLAQLCEALQCTIPLPQKPELLSIESSDLQADPSRPGLIMLTALLRNRAPFNQAFPALELTLTDTQDQAVVRRVFTSNQYLPKNANAQIGMAPNDEINVRLALDTGDLRAAGYRLYLFYP